MVELWNKLNINTCSGEVCYRGESLFSSNQKINELGEIPFGEWVLLIDRQLMPIEAINENLDSNQVQLSGLVFDICEGQDFYCDLNFSKNQLVAIDFGLTQKDDLSREQLEIGFLMIKEWFEKQGSQIGYQVNASEWLSSLIDEQMKLSEVFPWGCLSVKYYAEEGLIKISINYELTEKRGEFIE